MFRQRRAFVALLVVIVLIAALLFVRNVVAGNSGHHASTPVPAGPAVLQVEQAPWRLPQALSRSVVLPDEGRLVVAGGLAASNKTSGSMFGLDPQSGAVAEQGALAEPVHDAAGAAVGGRSLVFGGGAAKVSATVQGLTPTTSGLQAVKVGSLPAPRADLVAAAVGDQVVVAAGYDGTATSPDVWSTGDGTTFTTIARLPEPVRYPASLVRDNKLFLIGGDTPSGESTAIQQIDPASHQATVVARLSEGVSHASVAEIGGTILVFGGRRGGHATDVVMQVDLSTGATSAVARLPVAVSDMAVATLGDTVYLVGGETDKGQPSTGVVVARMVAPPATATTAAGTGAPFDGQLLIADRGNNRLLLVDADKHISWTFPSPTAPAPPQGFYFPDDAFFAKHGTAIITNEEEQHTIIELAYPSGQVLASYGHPNKPGAAPGYLNQPDDAYLLPDGRVTVADAKNCRILFLNADFTYASQIGTAGKCRHDPPRDIGYPNGDTPLPDGNVLVSEINGAFVDELTPDGTVVWSVHLPISYPSDPQQIGPDLYLIADYAKPGGLYEFTREGQITFSYSYPSGQEMLDHPSLTELLPSGRLCVNDDYRHRVVIIDPATKQIVWQYGQTDTAGTGTNELNTPDGFDLLAPDNTTPTHPQTG